MRSIFILITLFGLLAKPIWAESIGFKNFRLGAGFSAGAVGPEVQPYGYSWLSYSREADKRPVFDASIVTAKSEFSPPAEFKFYREKSGENLSFGEVTYEYLNLSYWNGVLYEITLSTTSYDESALQDKLIASRTYIESAYGQPRKLKQPNPRVYLWELDSGTIRLSYRFPSLFERGKPTEVRLSFIRSDPEFRGQANALLSKLEALRLESIAKEKASSERQKADAAQKAADALRGSR